MKYRSQILIGTLVVINTLLCAYAKQTTHNVGPATINKLAQVYTAEKNSNLSIDEAKEGRLFTTNIFPQFLNAIGVCNPNNAYSYSTVLGISDIELSTSRCDYIDHFKLSWFQTRGNTPTAEVRVEYTINTNTGPLVIQLPLSAEIGLSDSGQILRMNTSTLPHVNGQQYDLILDVRISDHSFILKSRQKVVLYGKFKSCPQATCGF